MLRLECVKCKTKLQLSLKRCKHFELGYVKELWCKMVMLTVCSGDKKTKGAALVF